MLINLILYSKARLFFKIGHHILSRSEIIFVGWERNDILLDPFYLVPTPNLIQKIKILFKRVNVSHKSLL